MDSLVKNKLMTKPLVSTYEPIEVVLKTPKEGTDIKGVTVRDARKKNRDFDIQDLKERLKQNKIARVQISRPAIEEEVSMTSEFTKPIGPIQKKVRKLNMKKKLLLVEDDEDYERIKKKDGTQVEEDDNIEPTEEELEKRRKDRQKRRTPKVSASIDPKFRGIVEMNPKEWEDVSGKQIAKRLPRKEAPIKIRIDSYYMNNRKIFVNFINAMFQRYKEELEDAEKLVTCDSMKNTEAFSLLTHQKIVRDYMNLYTPYRGLLLFHGLGSGKSCSSIAIAEGMKTKRQVIVMTPKSLRENYIEELKKCGDYMYKKKQYWEWISDPSLFDTLSNVLTLPIEYIQRKKGAWLMDISKKPNSLTTNDMKSLDDQLNEMIFSKYRFIPYNGLRDNRLIEMSENYTINPFDNKVVIIDEAHNFISRIVNRIEKERPIATDDRGEKEKLHKALSLKLYEFLLSAKNMRIVLLSGTPVINYPNELGIMFNILRGYIKTWVFPVTVKTSKKVTTETLQNMLINEKILDYLDYSPSSKKITITRNPMGFKNKTKVKTGYHGVSNQIRNEEGESEFDTNFISDNAFEKKIIELLDKHDIEVNPKLVKIINYKALPDKLESFVNKFIDPNTKTLINTNVFKKRILGLTSYYRSPQEGLMPRYEKTPEYYHVVKIPMSNYQFKIYEAARSTERKSEKSSKTKKGKFDKDGIYKEPTSTYRIFSRLFCNFVMPPEPGRPMPRDDKKMITGEDDDKGTKAQEEIIKKANEKTRNMDLNNDKEGELEGDEALGAVADNKYSDRIQAAIEDIRANAAEYLSKDGLEKYSPKFLTILENLQDPEYEGLHLIYSQFRTLEGIELLSMTLEANGFARFRVKKTSDKGWDIDIPEKDLGKPTFALYTGTESDEEKKLILKIYNGFWDDIPVNIANKLRMIANDNNMGEIIKVFMISSSGSEGINLKNTRYVHVVEPYWHPVRMEQVIGRARRICSHKDLDEQYQTVEVFVYLMTFTREQIDGDDAKDLKLKDGSKKDPSIPLTSDEFLYEISIIKEEINSQLTIAVKEAAIDCAVYEQKNESEGLQCITFGEPSNTSFVYNPDIEKDEDDVVAVLNETKETWKAEPVQVDGKTYAARKVKNNEYILYDAKAYERATKTKGNPTPLKRLRVLPDGQFEVNPYKLG